MSAQRSVRILPVRHRLTEQQTVESNLLFYEAASDRMARRGPNSIMSPNSLTASHLPEVGPSVQNRGAVLILD